MQAVSEFVDRVRCDELSRGQICCAMHDAMAHLFPHMREAVEAVAKAMITESGTDDAITEGETFGHSDLSDWISSLPEKQFAAVNEAAFWLVSGPDDEIPEAVEQRTEEANQQIRFCQLLQRATSTQEIADMMLRLQPRN